MSKKKKILNSKYQGKSKSQKNNIPDPNKFFRSIGLKPVNCSENHVARIIKKDFGEETERKFRVAERHQDHRQSWFFSHTNIELAKLRYCTDFDIICDIANQLSEIKVPSSPRVLDVGGAAGALAFLMKSLWGAQEVVVADMNPTMGENWANELGIQGIRYVNATLPDMNLGANQKFDVIVLSRVLHFIDGLDDLPSFFEAIDTDDYLNSKSCLELNILLERIAKELNSYLTNDGIVIIVESWSDARVLLIGRAFERQGLYIDFERFYQEKVSIKHSTIVFSKQKTVIEIPDLPLSLATMMDLKLGGPEFRGASAESIKKIFVDDQPVFSKTSDVEDSDIKVLDEIYTREGLTLLYRSGSDGRTRRAIIVSAAQLKENIELFSEDRTISLEK